MTQERTTKAGAMDDQPPEGSAGQGPSGNLDLPPISEWQFTDNSIQAQIERSQQLMAKAPMGPPG
jgi:hypothetical protein